MKAGIRQRVRHYARRKRQKVREGNGREALVGEGKGNAILPAMFQFLVAGSPVSKWITGKLESLRKSARGGGDIHKELNEGTELERR